MAVTAKEVKSLADVEPSTFDLLTPGKYLVRVHETAVVEGENGPYVEYGVTVREPKTVEGQVVLGRKVNFQRLFLTDKALPMTVGHLDGMVGPETRKTISGATQKELAQSIAKALKGATFVARIGIEKGKGDYEDRNRIRGAKPADSWTSTDDLEKSDIPF